MRKKKETNFIVDTNNEKNETATTNEICAEDFIKSLIENYKNGTYTELEVERLLKSKDLTADLNLILNDEKETRLYKLLKMIDTPMTADTLLQDFSENTYTE